MEHDVEQRLRELGRQEIDPSTRAMHRRRIAATAIDREPRRRGFVWAGIAAAAVTGFLAGSTGLAAADALPGPAQEVAHDVLGAVQVDVPAGKEGKRGPCVAEAAKIKDKDAKRAAKEACPKGGPKGGPNDGGDDRPSDVPRGNGQTKHEGDPCRGRPPWAGPMSKEDRAAAKAAASRENCPDDDSADDEAEEPATQAPAGD